MKKSILITILFLMGVSQQILSQTYSIKSKEEVKKSAVTKKYLGGRWGIGFNSMSENIYNNSTNSGSISILNLGGVAEFEISKLFSIQPELALISKGDKATSSYSSAFYRYNDEAIATANYLALNCLPKFRWNLKKIDLFLYTGMGYLIKTSFDVKETHSNLSQNTSTTNTTNVTQAVNTIDLILGGGVSKNMGSGKMFLDIRANRGLSSIFDSNLTSTKGNQFGINVGYSFEL